MNSTQLWEAHTTLSCHCAACCAGRFGAQAANCLHSAQCIDISTTVWVNVHCLMSQCLLRHGSMSTAMRVNVYCHVSQCLLRYESMSPAMRVNVYCVMSQCLLPCEFMSTALRAQD